MTIDAVSIVQQNRIDLNRDGKFNNEDLILASQCKVIPIGQYDNFKNVYGDDFVREQSEISNTRNSANSYYDMQYKLNEIKRFASENAAQLNRSNAAYIAGGALMAAGGGTSAFLLTTFAGLMFGGIPGAAIATATWIGALSGVGTAADFKAKQTEKREELKKMITYFDAQYWDVPEAKAEIEQIKKNNPWLET